eukprot:Gb_13772 [translate_table: standard]
MANSLNNKKNFRCVPALQQFYTGGPFRLSSDGSFIVCACNEHVKLVDLGSGCVKNTFEGDSELITALALSPDGKLLFSASRSRQIRVWDLSSATCQRSWKAHDGPVADMTCDASGGLLATAGADRNIFVWDIDGGYCTHSFRGHKGVVSTVIFHPDPHRLLLFSGSDDSTVRVWDLVTKKCIAVLEKHFSTVTSLAVSANGWNLLSAGRDKVVNIWDLRDNSFKTTIPTYEALEAVCIVPDGSKLVSGMSQSQHSAKKQKKGAATPVHFLTVGERGIVRIWSSVGALCLYEQKSSDAVISSDKEDLKGGFVSAVLLPSGQGVLCVTADQRFLFYDPVETDESKFDLKISKRLIGYNEEIVDLKFLGEEENFLVVATNLEQIRAYDVESMTCAYELSGHTDIVLCLDTCVTTSGRILLASGAKDHTVRIWDTETRSCIGVAAGHMGAVGAVALSKKAKNFFVSGSSDRTIKVWSMAGALDSGSICDPIKFSSQAVVAAHDKDINSLAVAPNDSLICSGSQDRTARVWRLPDLVPVVVLRGHKRGIWCVEFSPVDQCVMTASGDKTIKIWSLSDGSCLKTFEGHTASVLRASFLTRGTQLISSGADGLLKLWTIKSNECIATFDQHEDKIWALAIGKKTEMLASGGSDSLVNLWHDCTAADEEEALLKEEEGTMKDQDLANALADTDYVKAIQLAFELQRPYKLLNVFTELYSKGHAEDQIHKAIHALGKEQLRLLLEYVREWNTKPKFCHVAQFVLFHLFSVLPPTEIIELRGIRELMEGLIPYAQRHYSRIDRLLRSTFLLDYTLSSMSVLTPLETNLPSSNSLARKFVLPQSHIQQDHQSHSLEQNFTLQSVLESGNIETIEATTPQVEKKRNVSANGAYKATLSDVKSGEINNAFDDFDMVQQGSSKKHKTTNLRKQQSKELRKGSVKGNPRPNTKSVALQA